MNDCVGLVVRTLKASSICKAMEIAFTRVLYLVFLYEAYFSINSFKHLDCRRKEVEMDLNLHVD
jgi:hypothetical protein